MKRGHARLLAFITAYLRDHGYGPTVEEMRAGCAMSSKSVVCRALDKLAAKGLIRRLPDRHRAIELCRPAGLQFMPVAVDATGNAFIDASQAQPLAPVD